MSLLGAKGESSMRRMGQQTNGAATKTRRHDGAIAGQANAILVFQLQFHRKKQKQERQEHAGQLMMEHLQGLNPKPYTIDYGDSRRPKP